MKRIIAGLGILLIAALVVSGCAPRPSGGQTAAMAGEGDIVVDLPAVVLEFAEDGTAGIGDQPLNELLANLGVLPTLPPDTIQVMMAYNVQHIQLETHPEGISLRVNGLPFLGSLTYDAERLRSTVSVLEDLGASPMLAMMQGLTPVISAMLPLLDNLGVGVIAHFPMQPGAEALPLVSEEDMGADMAMDFLAEVDNQQPRITIPLYLASDGSWSAGEELNQALVEALMGPQANLGLPAETVALIAGAGIEVLSIRTTMDGLAISINGNGLPIFTWNNGEVANLATIDAPAPWGDVLGLVGALLPLLQVTNANISLHLPMS